MAEKTESPTYEEVVELKKGLEVSEDGQPKPDMPITIQPPAYGDHGHVNPALNPAPLWKPQADRIIVPVQNDPGMLGSSPSLADMNRAARADDMQRANVNQKMGERPDLDDTGGMTEDKNQDQVRQAAEARMAKLAQDREDAKAEAAETAKEAGAKPKKPEEAHPRHRRHSP